MLPFLIGVGGTSLIKDPYFSSVKALLHFDGSDTSTTITDQIGHTFIAQSGAKLSTTSPKFGSASLVLNGTSDYVSTPTTTDFSFNTGDWTVECWIKTTATGEKCIFASTLDGNNYARLEINSNTAGDIYYAHNVAGTYKRKWTTGTYTSNNGNWNHIAICCVSGVLTLYLNGTAPTQTGDGTLTNLTNINANYNIGQSGSGTLFFSGNIDDLRITKGVARYTGNFTSPTAAFPNS